MTPRGHRVIRDRHDLLYDTKGHSESDTTFFLGIKKILFITLELKFHVINNPNWSNCIIIYGFHVLPLYRFDRFHAVHLIRNRLLPVKLFCRKMNTLKCFEWNGVRHKPLFCKFHRITAWQKSLRDPKIRPIHAIFRLFELFEYKCWTCTEFSEAFTFLMENIYVQFSDMVYQQIVGIPMGTNCAPLIADLFLYCYERDFMSNLQKSKRFDLTDKFNDTSRYLDDIFTIDNPEFAEHIPDIYPRELQLNKANTSDKETSFMNLNIKVVGSNIHTSVYDKRDDFGFPIVNSPWLSGDVPRLPSYGIYISQLVRFARCCTSVFDFHSKNLQITSKLLTQGYRYHKLRKTFGKFFMSYSELLSKFGEISFQDLLSQGIAHPVFYGDLVYTLRRVKGEANFISSGSKIVKRLRRRQYDPAIIERTIGLVLGPFTALYRSFLKRCTLTNKAVGTIWRALSKPPQRRQGPDPRPLWLLVGTPSAFGPELAYRLRVAQPTLMDVARYFWNTLILLYMFVCYIFMTSRLWLAVGPQSI